MAPDPNLPPQDARRVSSFAFVPLPELDRRSYRFLLVDDDPDALALLEHGLKHARDFDAATTLAKDAEEARRELQKQTFDAVLADQVMPGQNGIDLLMEVRELAPETLRILITAYTSLGAVLRAVNLAQVHSYIEKPYDPRALNRALSEALIRRQERNRTQVIDAHNVGEAMELLRTLESNLSGPYGPSNRGGVTFTFDSPVEFNRFTFEVLQAKGSAIKDVHVFEGRFHVTLAIQPVAEREGAPAAA